MKQQWSVWQISFCLCLAFSAQSQAKPPHSVSARSAAHPFILPRYRLSLLELRDARPFESFWLIEEFLPGTFLSDGSKMAYKSLNGQSVLWWVSSLPKGTKILYWPPHSIIHNDFSTDDFGKFIHLCRSKGVIFRYMP